MQCPLTHTTELMQVPLQQVTTQNAAVAAEPWSVRTFLYELQLARLQ